MMMLGGLRPMNNTSQVRMDRVIQQQLPTS